MTSRLKWKLGVVLSVFAGTFAYANWNSSALHRHVCGSDAPFTENMMWLLHGERVIDNWPARLSGCKPPPGYAEYKAKAGFHSKNGRLEYTPTGNDYSEIKLAIELGGRKARKNTAAPSDTPK